MEEPASGIRTAWIRNAAAIKADDGAGLSRRSPFWSARSGPRHWSYAVGRMSRSVFATLRRAAVPGATQEVIASRARGNGYAHGGSDGRHGGAPSKDKAGPAIHPDDQVQIVSLLSCAACLSGCCSRSSLAWTLNDPSKVSQDNVVLIRSFQNSGVFGWKQSVSSNPAGARGRESKPIEVVEAARRARRHRKCHESTTCSNDARIVKNSVQNGGSSTRRLLAISPFPSHYLRSSGSTSVRHRAPPCSLV